MKLLAKNSLWLFIARVGTQGAMVLFTIIIARRLGSAGFGEYAFIAAIIFVANMLTTFGTDMSLIREIAAHDNLSQLPAALLIQLVISFILIVVIWFSAPYLPNQSADSILALRVYSFALIPLAFFTVFTIVLRGKQQMDSYTWLNLIGSFLQLALVFLFIKQNSSAVALAFVLLFDQIIVSLIGAIICKNQIHGFWSNWKITTKDVSLLLEASSPLALLTVIAISYQKLSIAMISMIGGAAMTGLFSVSQRAVEAAKTGHAAIFTALYPAMAQDKNESFHLPWIVLLIGAAIGAKTLSVLAKPLVLGLFGTEYEASIPVLQILAWILIPYTVSTFLTLKFIAFKRERPVLQASLASLIFLAAFNLYWIPRKGLIGASGAALSAEIIQAGLLVYSMEADMSFPNFPDKYKNESLLKADDIVAYRKRLGRMLKFKNLDGILFCLERGLPRRMRWKIPVKRIGSMNADVDEVKRNGVSVLTNFGGGSPIVAELAEELAVMGARRMILMTWGGILQPEIKAGDIVVCNRAIRDEGTSHHYLAPAKYIDASDHLVDQIATAIRTRGKEPAIGTTWTTDAPYRETLDEVKQYQSEGVKTVEMESAGLFTIGQVRGVQTASVVIGMDSLASYHWQVPEKLDDIMHSLEIVYAACIDVLWKAS